jgi:phosphatidylglycerophosphatase A
MRTPLQRLIVFVAEGFGTGRSPFAPGTFGTLLGFAWIYLLLLPRSLPLYLAGIIGGLLAAIWIGARAEEILGLKDPGSIVIDEITALPIAFLPVVLARSGQPAPEYISHNWLELAMVFALFRLFDIWKPLGIRRSQALPAGLVLDDVLAAALSAIVLWGCILLIR